MLEILIIFHCLISEWYTESNALVVYYVNIDIDQNKKSDVQVKTTKFLEKIDDMYQEVTKCILCR